MELKEATAEQVLDALLKSRGYDYEIVDQVVVIRKGAAVYAPEIPRHVRVLQGTVKDSGGRPLPGVTVRIKGNDPGGWRRTRTVVIVWNFLQIKRFASFFHS